MEEGEIDFALRKVAKGAGVFLFGTSLGLILGLITRILVVRYISKFDYGVLTLSLVILGITQTIISFGIPGAMVRQASFFFGRNENEKAESIIKLSGYLVAILGVFGCLILIFISNNLASIFKAHPLSWILKIFAISLPFVAMNNYFISLYQTLKKPEIKVIFGDFALNFAKLALIAIVILVGLSFKYIVFSYTISPIIVSIVFLVFSLKTVKFSKKRVESYLAYLKTLLSFSFPLLIQSILGMIVMWTDLLMIGYMMTPKDVAVYGAARPLAGVLMYVLTAVNFLYFPIISQLFGKGLLKEVGRTYAVVTKWIASSTLPVFLVMFLYPKAVIWVVYGAKYLDASPVLEILALTFFIHVAFGPNGLTLIALGENKFVTAASLATAIANIILNCYLIPIYGIIGAAFATMVSYVFSNFLCSFRLFTKYKIHAFTKNYAKPIVISSAIAFVIGKIFTSANLFELILLFVFFIFAYLISLLLTKSFDREDLMLINSIEQKTGMNLKFIKKILKRFV